MPGIEILGPAPAEVGQATLERWLLFKKEASASSGARTEGKWPKF